MAGSRAAKAIVNYRMPAWKICVLVVADQLEERAKIAHALQSAGRTVELAPDANRALKLAADRNVEAAIVAMGREPAGRAVARKLRGAVPKVIALVDPPEDGGWPDRSLFPADAFLLRPLDERQLLGRLAEVRASPPSPIEDGKPEVYCFEGCRLDLAGRIFVDAGGQEIPLTRSEAELLTILVRNPRRVLSRDQLRHSVVGHGVGTYDRTVDVLVGRLRHKIEPDPKAPRLILAVSGAGYKFTAATQSAKASEAPSPVMLRTEFELSFPDRPEAEEGLHPKGVTSTLPNHVERRQVTMLCCGLAGLTVLGGSPDFEEVEGVIGDFRRAATAAVERWGGSIARLTGEEILAQFGYPHAHEDDAERAVQAALDLVAIAAEIRSPSGERFEVRAAIATGFALLGQGQEIIGEPPMLAARLRTTAAPNTLIVTAATHRLIGGVFELEGPVPHQLEGGGLPGR